MNIFIDFYKLMDVNNVLVFITVATLFVCIINYVLYSKIPFVEVLITLGLVAFALYYEKSAGTQKAVIMILSMLNAIALVVETLINGNKKNIIDGTIANALKNNYEEIYFRVNKSLKIVEFNTYVQKQTQLKSSELKSKTLMQFIDENFNVLKINKANYDINLLTQELNDISKNSETVIKLYTSNNEVVTAMKLIIEPIKTKFLIGYSVIIKFDKEDEKNNSYDKIEEYNDHLLNATEKLKIVANLTPAIFGYYDSNLQVYVLTDLFRKYTKSNLQTIDPEEYIKHINKLDFRKYVAMCDSFSNSVVTTINYRLLFDNFEFIVDERVMLQGKNSKIISVIILKSQENKSKAASNYVNTLSTGVGVYNGKSAFDKKYVQLSKDADRIIGENNE